MPRQPKKEEEGKMKVEEANQGLAENKDKLQKLAQQLQAGPKPDEVVKISKEIRVLARAGTNSQQHTPGPVTRHNLTTSNR